MKSEFILAFNEICESRGLPKEDVFEALKTALVSAYRRDSNLSSNQMVTVEIDARVGGSFYVVERRDGEDAEHYGEYLEIDRPRRLVFTFANEKGARDGDRISIDIVPMESGCELTLTHEMSPEWAEWADRTRQGWTDIVEGLGRVLEA